MILRRCSSLVSVYSTWQIFPSYNLGTNNNDESSLRNHLLSAWMGNVSRVVWNSGFTNVVCMFTIIFASRQSSTASHSCTLNRIMPASRRDKSRMLFIKASSFSELFFMAAEWLKLEDTAIKRGEFYIMTLSTLLGMYLMISAGHFLMFFIGLETASIPMAALVAFDKYRHHSAEAGAKYILTALFSSALLLFGLSMIYGTCGTYISASRDGDIFKQ